MNEYWWYSWYHLSGGWIQNKFCFKEDFFKLYIFIVKQHLNYTQRNNFGILLNQTEIGLYYRFDWEPNGIWFQNQKENGK